MSDQLCALLKEQYEISQNQTFVFSAPFKNDAMLARTTLNRALVFIGLPEATTHDFRATASTLLNEKGYKPDWINKQLAHAEENKTRLLIIMRSGLMTVGKCYRTGRYCGWVERLK